MPAVAALACGDPAGLSPAEIQRTVAGAYVLERVDGQPVGEGESSLRLLLAAPEPSPRYELWVSSALVPGGESGAGPWDIAGDQVRLYSTVRPEPYTATIAPNPAGAPSGLRLALRRVAGPTYTFRRVRGDPDATATARLEVRVVDPVGRLVAGTLLRVRQPDGLVTRVGTPGTAPVLLSGPPGTWEVAITVPRSYALAPGQANPVRVSVPTQTDATPLVIRLTI